MTDNSKCIICDKEFQRRKVNNVDVFQCETEYCHLSWTPLAPLVVDILDELKRDAEKYHSLAKRLEEKGFKPVPPHMRGPL